MMCLGWDELSRPSMRQIHADRHGDSPLRFKAIFQAIQKEFVWHYATGIFKPASYRFGFSESRDLFKLDMGKATFVGRASRFKSRINRIAFERTARIIDPFRNRFGFAKGGYEAIGTAIQGLLFAICPCAVIRRVRAIIVLALKRQPANVAISVGPTLERRETRLPFIADFNATSAVSMVAGDAGDAAPMSHVSPNPKQPWGDFVGHTKLSHFGGSK